jgi:hypothetical protein
MQKVIHKCEDLHKIRKLTIAILHVSTDLPWKMLPTLKLASDKKEHSLKQTIDMIAQMFSLTQVERKRVLPSGVQTVI